MFWSYSQYWLQLYASSNVYVLQCTIIEWAQRWTYRKWLWLLHSTPVLRSSILLDHSVQKEFLHKMCVTSWLPGFIMTTWTKKPSWSTVDNEEEELHWVQDNNNCPVMYVCSMYLYVYVCMSKICAKYRKKTLKKLCEF